MTHITLERTREIIWPRYFGIQSLRMTRTSKPSREKTDEFFSNGGPTAVCGVRNEGNSLVNAHPERPWHQVEGACRVAY